MGKIIAVTSASLLLFTSAVSAATNTAQSANSQTTVISGSAAGGHESVEALKAEITDLQTKLQDTSDGRSYLLKQLKEALSREKDATAKADELMAMQAAKTEELETQATKVEELMAMQAAKAEELEAAQATSSAETTELQKSLSFMTDSRDYLYEELTTANAATEDAVASAKTSHAGAIQDKSALHGRIQKLADDRDAAAKAHSAEIAKLEQQIERTETGREYLSDRLEIILASTSAEKAKLEKELKSATVGRDYLASRLSTTLESSSTETAALEQELDDVASVAFVQINSAIAERDAARAAAAESEQEIEDIAAVSFTQINSAIAERDAAIQAASDTSWADGLSTNLTEAFGDLDGTEVTARNDNSVSIKVGNTGLFRLGSTALSDAGKEVLGQIGGRLADQADSKISVIGHTDNVPVGTGSRFSSNAELSLARASSALSHLTGVGVPPERMSASGVGDIYPIASNDTDDGRLANRRVEIVLSPAN